VPTMITASWH